MKKLYLILGFLFGLGLLTGIYVHGETPGGLTLPQGGLGITTVSPGAIVVGSNTVRVTSTTSPTVGYITATSTTASSTFANGINATGGCFAYSGTCINNTNGTVTSVTGTWPITSSGGAAPNITFGWATTSQPSSSNLFVSNGSNGFYGVATSTLTPTSPLTGSFTVVGSSGSVGCQTASGSQAGCLSSGDWTTFNNKVSTTRNINTTYPLSGGGSLASDLTLTFSGLGTTSPWTAGQLAYVVNGNTVTSVATSSATCSSGVTCSTFTVVGSVAPSITNAGVLSVSCTTITCSGTNPATFSIGNSVITNAMLANSSLTVTAGTGLSGGGLVSLGGSVTLNLATPVTVANGGTGQTTLTQNQLLYGVGTGAVQSVATSSASCTTGISCSAFTVVGTVSPSIIISAPVSIANGGTNNTSAYTAGSVVFSDGSKLTQNNSQLFWDNTNNRLGLATTSPWALLSVNGNAIGSAPQFAVGSSSATDLMVTNGGNIGLGTSSPMTATLTSAYGNLIIGGASTGGILLGQWVAAGYSAIGLSEDISSANYNFISGITDTNLYINRPSGKDIKFREANSNADSMTIKSGGLVGIGITNPGQPLVVTGSGFQAAVLGQRTDSSTVSIILGLQSSTASADVQMQNNAGLFTIANGGTIGSSFGTNRFQINSAGRIFYLSPASEAGTNDALCRISATGEIQVNSGISTCLVSSARFKHNIATSTTGLDLITKLRPVTYSANGDNSNHFGFVAEDVAKIEPRLVDYETVSTTTKGVTATSSIPRGVRYEELTSPLATAIQELWSWTQSILIRLSGAEARINALQNEVDTLIKLNHLATSTPNIASAIPPLPKTKFLKEIDFIKGRLDNLKNI